MSENRQQVDPDMSRPVATPEPERNNSTFRAYSIAVFVVGAIAAGLVSWWLPLGFHTSLLWVAPLLVIGFLLAERLAMNIDVRGDVSWTVSFTEIPMVVGLLIAPFQVVLVAHVVAGVGTMIARKVGDRVLYNAGVFMIEAASAFAIATVICRALPPGPWWIGSFVGVLAVPLSSTLLAVVAVRMLGRRMRLSSAGPLVVLVSLGVLALYFAYSGLLREQRDLEALADVSLMVVRSGQHIARPAIDADPSVALPPTEDWQVIAERIKDQVGARRIVLRLWPDPRQEMQTVVAGEPLPARRLDPRAVREDPLLRLAGA